MSIGEEKTRRPGPYRDCPDFTLLELGLCPHADRPRFCAALIRLSGERDEAVRQLRGDLVKTIAYESETILSDGKRTAYVGDDSPELHPEADAAIDTFYRHIADRAEQIHQVLGGSCTGGCELEPPAAA